MQQKDEVLLEDDEDPAVAPSKPPVELVPLTAGARVVVVGEVSPITVGVLELEPPSELELMTVGPSARTDAAVRAAVAITRTSFILILLYFFIVLYCAIFVDNVYFMICSMAYNMGFLRI